MDTTTLESEKRAAADAVQAHGDAPRERMPAMQSLIDNHFLLLFIGVAVPAVFYLIWGIMEVAQIRILP